MIIFLSAIVVFYKGGTNTPNNSQAQISEGHIIVEGTCCCQGKWSLKKYFNTKCKRKKKETNFRLHCFAKKKKSFHSQIVKQRLFIFFPRFSCILFFVQGKLHEKIFRIHSFFFYLYLTFASSIRCQNIS